MSGTGPTLSRLLWKSRLCEHFSCKLPLWKYGTTWDAIRLPYQSKPYTQPANKHARKNVMSAWQVQHYGGPSDLKLSRDVGIPAVKSPTDVLVEVKAASVNPIDTMMIGGYGSKTLNAFRQLCSVGCSGPATSPEFPLTPGRDFSGVVVATGKDVLPYHFKPGDEVWGAGEAWRRGTHAEYYVISSKQISHKPKSLSHAESASLPYVAATSWSALCTIGRIEPGRMVGKSALVLGGSGGIGTFAIQLLKAWGADVTTTCSPDAIDLVLGLGADIAMDYTQPDAHQQLCQLNKFDVILDGTGVNPSQSIQLLKKYSNAKYITFVTPFLRNNDSMGFPWGMLTTGFALATENIGPLQEGRTVRHALFLPSGKAMREVAKLVDAGKIRPVLEKVYPFDQIPEAYEKVSAKHNRGKTVIDFTGEYSATDDQKEPPSVD